MSKSSKLNFTSKELIQKKTSPCLRIALQRGVGDSLLRTARFINPTMLYVGNFRREALVVLRKVPLGNTARNTIRLCTTPPIDYTLPAGTPGSGAGKGGGSGGSVREAGGGLGRLGAALEEGYFHQQQKEQLKQIKKKLKRGEPIGHSDKPAQK